MEVGNFLSRFSNRIEEMSEKIDNSSDAREKNERESEMAQYLLSCLPYMSAHTDENDDTNIVSVRNDDGSTHNFNTVAISLSDLMDVMVPSMMRASNGMAFEHLIPPTFYSVVVVSHDKRSAFPL